MSTSDSTQLLPHPRRLVTGHTPTGAATLLQDSLIPSLRKPTGSNYAVLWQTPTIPANNSDSPTDSANGTFHDPITSGTASLANDKGAILRVVDFQPGQKGMFHRTVSLDFGILFSGEIVCVLDNDEEVHMKPGDVCIQRGTIHGWHNRGTEPARMYFVLLAAEPIQIGDSVLESTGFRNADVASEGK